MSHPASKTPPMKQELTHIAFILDRSGYGVQESMDASHDFVSERRRRKKKDN